MYSISTIAMTHLKAQPVAVAVVRHQGQYLVGIRPAGIPLAGYSEFPGGKLRAGESPEQAALRECAEETGLQVTAVGRFPTVLHDYAHGRLEINFIDCRPIDGPISPQPPFVWIDQEELKRRKFPEANASLLRQLLASVPQA